VRSSGKSSVFDFGCNLFAVVVPQSVHMKEEMRPECLRRNCTFSLCNIGTNSLRK
jgi:hypothetical protein